MPAKHPDVPVLPDNIPLTFRDHPDYDPTAPVDIPTIVPVYPEPVTEEAPSHHKPAKPAGKEN